MKYTYFQLFFIHLYELKIVFWLNKKQLLLYYKPSKKYTHEKIYFTLSFLIALLLAAFY